MRLKHTSRVGPAVAGGLVYSGREKETESQWSDRVEPVFDSKYGSAFGSVIVFLVVMSVKNGNILD